MKETLIGWICVMVTSGWTLALTAGMTLPGWMKMGPVLPSIGEMIPV